MVTADWLRQLQDLLEREIQTAEALHARLCEERTLLANDPAAIERAAADKQGLVEQLEQHDAARARLLAHAGYGADPHEMSRFLEQGDRGGVIQRRWDRLLEILEQCQQQNLLNGAIVEAARHSVRDALTVLHGQSPRSETYGATGKTDGPALSRPLAKA